MNFHWIHSLHYGVGPPGSAAKPEIIVDIIISIAGAGLIAITNTISQLWWMVTLLMVLALTIYAMNFYWKRSEDEDDETEQSIQSTKAWLNTGDEAITSHTSENGNITSTEAWLNTSDEATTAVSGEERRSGFPAICNKEAQKNSNFLWSSQCFKIKASRRNSNEFQSGGLMSHLLTEMCDTELECFGEMSDSTSEEFLSF